MNLEVNNLTLGYDNSLFENLDFTIYPNTFTTILGKNGVGKTSLIKALIGDINYSGQIKYNNTLLSNETKEKIRNKVSVIYNTNLFIFNNLYDELVFSLQKSGYVDSIIDTTIEDMVNDLNLKYLLYKKISEFSESEKQLGTLLIMIINKPELLIIDNTLNNLEYDLKIKIISYLKKMDITILNVSDNVEDILLSDKTFILNDKKCVCINNIYELNENIFNESNLKLPFMIDLCNKLKYYDLLDKITLDKNELVDEIWK